MNELQKKKPTKVHGAQGSHLKPICEYNSHILPHTKHGTTKNRGKNYIEVRPLVICHLLRDHLLVNEGLKRSNLQFDYCYYESLKRQIFHLMANYLFSQFVPSRLAAQQMYNNSNDIQFYQANL